MDLLADALKQIHLNDAEWFGLREVKETSTYRSSRDAKPTTNRTIFSHGVMVEVLSHGQFGYAATTLLDEKSIANAAQHARDQAVAAAKSGLLHKFSAKHRAKPIMRYETKQAKPFSALSPGDIAGLLIKITKQLKCSDKIIRAEAALTTSDIETRILTSSGADAFQKLSLISTDFEATAEQGNVVQKRSSSGMSFQGGLEFFLAADLWERVDKVAKQALELLLAQECPSETTSLVLMPDQMMLQIHESIGHPLELDRILGDERNYAGWSFVKPDDFGKLRYGSPKLNITFDPTIPHEFASYAFDDNASA
ncbi:MAG: TldD/PmbA family protein, partial [Bdellovibrionota bacterium]